nr:peptidylprolyl isomerase [uncultured Roseateles sp.]
MTPSFALNLTLLVALSGYAAQTAHAQAANTVADSAVVISAKGLSITKADFEQMLAGDPRLAMAREQSSAKSALGADFGRAFALEAEARRRQLDRLPSVQLKVRAYTQQVLANELLLSLRKEYLKDDALLAQTYASEQDRFAQPRVRHILVRMQGSQVALRKGMPDLSEAQARAKAEGLLSRLSQGADFAKLAKSESDDLGSNDKGGDIGFVPKGATSANFEAAAYSLPIGQLSKLVQTEYGFHILRVEDRKALPLDTVKAMIANELAHRDLDAIIRDGYTLNTAYFGN